MGTKPNKAEYRSDGVNGLIIQYDHDQKDQEIIIINNSAQDGYKQCAFSAAHIIFMKDILFQIGYNLPKEVLDDTNG